jgi:hypothetical protein
MTLETQNVYVSDENALGNVLKQDKNQQPRRRAALVDISNQVKLL